VVRGAFGLVTIATGSVEVMFKHYVTGRCKGRSTETIEVSKERKLCSYERKLE